MDSSCFYRALLNKDKSLLKFVLFFMALLSFPCAAAGQFSFIEYNLAFVLGLSLPILVIAVLLQKKISINWGFPAFITLSVLLLFYSVSKFSNLQSLWSLTAAILLLASIFLWPFFNKTEQVDKHKKYLVAVITVTTIIFIISIWFIPKLNAYSTWLIASTLILVSALFRIVKSFNQPQQYSGRIIFQWIIACLFSASIYLWLNTKLSENSLVIVCVLIYLITLINGCWLLVQRIYSEISLPQEVKVEKITASDLFAYTHDPATNLPSYQHAIKQFEQVFNHNQNPHYAAVVFQPVNFTQVNSILGHHNSNVLLLQLAFCLQEKSSTNSKLINFDTSPSVIRLARLQGLRFLVILDLSDNHYPEQTVTDDLCKQLASAVPEALSFKSFSLNFELAFGIAITNKHNENVEQLITHAEDALLVAQNNKKMINYFDSSHLTYTNNQLARMETLKSSIINEQLEWFAQPQIHLRSKRIVGFVLSVFWQPDKNNDTKLSLAEFINIAELSGDIYLLARQMITQAFKLLFTLHQSGNYQHVSVNLSSKHLLEPDLINFIESQKDRYNISTKYLLIELNEELIFSENVDVKNFTDQLKALDIGIIIVNFSGSYDALRFLRKALVNRIKISCQPLTEHAEMATDKAIINALINLASTMKIPLIGTDVDNKFIERSFASMGGELAQGKVINASISPEKVPSWLSSWYQQYPEANPKN